MGIKVFRPRKGSVVHESLLRYAIDSLRRTYPDMNCLRTPAGTMDGVQPDAVPVTATGERFALQACYRNSPKYEAEAVLRLLKFVSMETSEPQKVEFIVCITANKKHKTALERALKRQNKGEMPEKMVLLDFDTVIEAKFDWEEVFTLMTG